MTIKMCLRLSLKIKDTYSTLRFHKQKVMSTKVFIPGIFQLCQFKIKLDLNTLTWESYIGWGVERYMCGGVYDIVFSLFLFVDATWIEWCKNNSTNSKWVLKVGRTFKVTVSFHSFHQVFVSFDWVFLGTKALVIVSHRKIRVFTSFSSNSI